MSTNTDLRAILLQYRAELRQGLNELAGHDPLEQAERAIREWAISQVPEERKLDNVSGKDYHNGFNACRATTIENLKGEK